MNQSKADICGSYDARFAKYGISIRSYETHNPRLYSWVFANFCLERAVNVS